MDDFVTALRGAVAAGAWHSALALALALPDICGRVETPGDASSKRYPRWWVDNVQHKYSMSKPVNHVFLSGDDAYALRCAFLHEGQDDIVAQRARKAISKFAFTDPKHGNHCIQVDSVLQLSVDVFCNDVADSVSAWSAQRASSGLTTEPVNVLKIPEDLQIGNVFIGGFDKDENS